MTDSASSTPLGAIQALSIIVPDASAAAHEVSAHFGWPLGDVDEVGFADVHAGAIALWFSTSAPVPGGPVDGLMMHVFVEDVDAAAQAAVARGA